MGMANCTLLMNQQQTINKYVDLIKKYEKRKKSNKLGALTDHPHKLLTLTHTLFFAGSVQQKIKAKVKEKEKEKEEAVPLRPTLKTLHIDTAMHEMSRTKRKYQAYQEQMQRKHLIEKQAEDRSPREKRGESHTLRQNRKMMQESSQFVPVLGQTSSLLTRKSEQPGQKSEHTRRGQACELDGSIFHFESSTLTPPAFFRNMFQSRDIPKGKEEVYQMLKTTSPLTIKSKVHPQVIIDARSLAFRPTEGSPPGHSQPGQPDKASRISVRQLVAKSKEQSQMHRRERSSLVNLWRRAEEISGWELTEEY